jgi:hypothetical protein
VEKKMGRGIVGLEYGNYQRLEGKKNEMKQKSV